MRVSVLVGWFVVVGLGGARAADTDGAAVRECSGRYTAAILKKDAAGLSGLLHESYLGQNLPGSITRPDRDKRQAVAYWTDSGLTFNSLKMKAENVRLFGDTAVETGSLSGMSRQYGTNNIYGSLRYSRVWVRDGQGWRLAHEQY